MRASGTSNRQILALAVPATAALAADPLLSLVDTALVGRLGPTPLAALGIDAAVFTTVFWVFNVLTWGTTAARLRGAGRGDEAAADALQALWLRRCHPAAPQRGEPPSPLVVASTIRAVCRSSHSSIAARTLVVPTQPLLWMSAGARRPPVTPR